MPIYVLLENSGNYSMTLEVCGNFIDVKKDNAIGNNDAGNDLIYTKQTKNNK